MSMWEPVYRRVDGRPEISYPRQAIRHGESEPAADPVTLRCADEGEREIG